MRALPNELKPVPPSRGVVRGWTREHGTERVRVAPPDALAPYVHHLWALRWSLATPQVGEALPYPSAQIVLEEQDGVRNAHVAGPRTRRWTDVRSGEGRVLGITFRPATLAALLGPGEAMTRLTDRTVPLRDVLGDDADAWARATHDEPDTSARIALAVELLARRLPPLPADVRRTRDVVEQMSVDRAIVRVEDACALAGVDARELQRRFRRFVGVSPKWVIRRFRLHEAMEQLRSPAAPSLAALAAALGYADQSHFARDFVREVGITPRRFAASVAP